MSDSAWIVIGYIAIAFGMAMLAAQMISHILYGFGVSLPKFLSPTLAAFGPRYRLLSLVTGILMLVMFTALLGIVLGFPVLEMLERVMGVENV